MSNRSKNLEYPRLEFQQALDCAVNAKRSEVLRDRTLRDLQLHRSGIISISMRYDAINRVNTNLLTQKTNVLGFGYNGEHWFEDFKNEYK